MARSQRFVLAVLLCMVSVPAQGQSHVTKEGGREVSSAVLPHYSHAASAFPEVLVPFKPNPISRSSRRTRRLRDVIHDGRLRLSLSEALALAIENNLDIAVQRYVHPIAQADIPRTSSGQAARGVPGATLLAGLSAAHWVWASTGRW
jgi:hypothetical protein